MLSSKKISPIILGFDGYEIDDKTRELIARLSPVGFILFKRNCKDAEQLKALCDELIALSPLSKPLIFIDQEGGRVNRILWDDYIGAAPRTFGEIYEKSPQKGMRAAELNAYLIARQLRSYGITANCSPVADILVEDADDIIGDRAFSSSPEVVSALVAATIKGLMAGGVWPVIKHVPGHGRAMVDSHKELPVVTAGVETLEQDFAPFIANQQSPFLMTAHVKYTALDEVNCATTSRIVIKNWIREHLGMNGLIIADDMFMQALDGTLNERIKDSVDAGCDLVICGSTSIDGKFSADFWSELMGLDDSICLSDSAREKIENLPDLPKRDKLQFIELQHELDEILAA